MSYDACKYCHRPMYKTNGKAEAICYSRAYTGSCEGIQPRKIETLVGRNDPCPCGSALKYKKCCINKQTVK